jgi:serine/threonine-protein kinase
METGSRLGPYEIEDQLGAGGMGEVYLARDTRLGRKVAIKILPPQFAADAERLARFEQEARAAAALNHPHIAVVHDVGFDEGTHYLVQEYLEGQNLREPLQNGALPLPKALLYAREIAEALAAAHEAGIVHRDLKPENIFLTKDGHTKILDFGLAKLTELQGPGGQEMSMSPTVLSTVAGQVMGTAGYMAPEQIQGDVEIDARADLFAFGCLLYEMVGGTRAFSGESLVDTLHAITRTDPQPVGEIDPEMPAELERILKKALAKDRDVRYQHADDILVDLRSVAGEVEAGTAQTIAERERGGAESGASAGGLSWAIAVPAAVVIAALAGLAAWTLAPAGGGDEQRVARFLAEMPEGVNFTNPGWHTIAISADGQYVAVAANNQIYTRALDEQDAVPVRGTGGQTLAPFFSPDAQWVGFWQGNALYRVSLGGGAAVKLVDLSTPPLGVQWADDGHVYYSDAGTIRRVSADGGEAETIIAANETMTYEHPQWLPDGSLLYLSSSTASGTYDESSIELRRPGATEGTVLVSGGRNPRYVESGQLVYGLAGAVFARPFNLAEGTVGGAVAMLEGVAGSAATSGAVHFDISAAGDLIYVSGGQQADPRTFVWRDGNGGKEVIAEAKEAGRTWTPRLSPSGRYLAYRVQGGAGNRVWMLDLQRGIHSEFTPEGGARSFAWSPDGEYLYFSADSGTDSGTDMYRRPADMREEAEEFLGGPGNEFVRSISRDGEWLLYADTDVINTGAYDIKAMSLREPGEPRVLFDRDTQELTATVAPNGRWVAYVAVTGELGSEPVWSPDSKRLFYRTAADIMVVDVISEEPFDISAPRLFATGALTPADRQNAGSFDVSLDGSRLLMVDWDDAAGSTQAYVNIVLGWTRELNDRVAPER